MIDHVMKTRILYHLGRRLLLENETISSKVSQCLQHCTFFPGYIAMLVIPSTIATVDSELPDLPTWQAWKLRQDSTPNSNFEKAKRQEVIIPTSIHHKNGIPSTFSSIPQSANLSILSSDIMLHRISNLTSIKRTTNPLKLSHNLSETSSLKDLTNISTCHPNSAFLIAPSKPNCSFHGFLSFNRLFCHAGSNRDQKVRLNGY